MRHFGQSIAAGLMIILLLLVVAACGNDNKTASDNPAADSGTTANETDTAGTPAASNQPETRLYTDSTGKEITVPAAPRNVAAINFVGDLLALGVKPGYTTDYNLATFGAKLDGVSTIGNRPVNTEVLISDSPDLIITDDTGDKTENDQLSKIAPTITLEFWTTDPFGHLNQLAELLNKQTEAASWIEAYNTEVKNVKQQIQTKVKDGETALLVIISGKDIGISGIRNGGFTLYSQLGFAPPEKMKPLLDKNQNFGFETLTLEALPGFSPDNLFIEMDDDSQFTQDTFKELQKSEVWNTLTAVKTGKVYTVSNKWGLGDASSLKDQLAEALVHIVKS